MQDLHVQMPLFALFVLNFIKVQVDVQNISKSLSKGS